MLDETPHDLAVRVAAAVQSVEGVVRLCGEVAEEDGGRSSGAVRLVGDLVEVHLVARPDADPHLLAERVRRVVHRVIVGRVVAVVIEDVEPEG